MVIVVLLAAIAFYIALYLLYAYLQQNISTTEGWLSAIHSMIFLPETTIFGVFRLAILLIILYVVVDSIFSGARGFKRRKRERKQREADELQIKVRSLKSK